MRRTVRACIQEVHQVGQAFERCTLSLPAALYQATKQPELALQPGIVLRAICTMTDCCHAPTRREKHAAHCPDLGSQGLPLCAVLHCLSINVMGECMAHDIRFWAQKLVRDAGLCAWS